MACISFFIKSSKNLYKKIHDLQKYFNSVNKDENYELSLKNLSESKIIVYDFFDNALIWFSTALQWASLYCSTTSFDAFSESAFKNCE